VKETGDLRASGKAAVRADRAPGAAPSATVFEAQERTGSGLVGASFGKLVYVAVIGFVPLISTAMVLYPGGHLWDRTAPGYDFWHNFWCDLLRNPAYNGLVNRSAPIFAQAAMFVLALGLAAYFMLAPRLFETRAWLARLVSTLGVCGALGLAMVSGLSSGSFPRLHGIAVLVAAPMGLIALLGTLVGIASSSRASRRCFWLGVAALGASLFGLVQYTREFAFAAPSSPWLPISQKLATLLVLSWMWVVSGQATRARLKWSGATQQKGWFSSRNRRHR
jgi:hypothetical protein